MTRVIGIDGAPGGWIVVTWDKTASYQLHRNISDVLALQADVIAVDMPIGLPKYSGRNVEPIARQILKGKASSVFSVPARAAIQDDQLTYQQACDVNMKHSVPTKKFSMQSFMIFPKIRELDRLITPELQTRVHEVHPEVSFAVMNGMKAVLSKKSTGEGRAKRISLLIAAGFPWDALSGPSYLKKFVADNDIVDACACAWSARRIFERRALCIPSQPESDDRGLSMSIKA
jgi:predicted RNase H-like nuclease